MIAREELLRVRRLASRANPRIKDWASLGDKDGRDRLGITIAEGAKLVDEGLAAGSDGRFRPAALLVSDAGASRPEAGALFARAGDMGLERFSLSDDCYAKVSGLKNADGLALLLEIPRDAADLPALLSRDRAKWLAAAGVQDPGNAGALARTALAAGMDGCLFIEGADPLSPKFLRGCMGAAFRFPCLPVSLDGFVAALAASGAASILATSHEGAEDYSLASYEPPVVLIVGGERGVPREVGAVAGRTVHIPLAGGVESLNLAVAAGVILFEAAKRWR